MSTVSSEKLYEPPKCPSCGVPLERVWENVYETYVFDPKTGRYTGEPVDMDIKCPDCQTDLRDVLPDGACNYDAANPPEPDETLEKILYGNEQKPEKAETEAKQE